MESPIALYSNAFHCPALPIASSLLLLCFALRCIAFHQCTNCNVLDCREAPPTCALPDDKKFVWLYLYLYLCIALYCHEVSSHVPRLMTYLYSYLCFCLYLYFYNNALHCREVPPMCLPWWQKVTNDCGEERRGTISYCTYSTCCNSLRIMWLHLYLCICAFVYLYL